MFHALLRNRRLRKTTGAGLALLVLLAASSLPAGPRALAAADDGSAPNIPSVPPGRAYRQTNLISDIPGLAPVLDPLLRNPWGISMRNTSPFWLSNNRSDTTQLVRGDVGGAPVALNPANPGPQTVAIPGGAPTGTVGNTSSDFQITPPGGGSAAAANFLFVTLNGDLLAWNTASGNSAQVVRHMTDHVWTGLAIGAATGGNRLYAADFAQGHIDVFDGSFNPTTAPGGFVDPTVPADYHPYNIQNLGGFLYVTYAKPKPMGVINGAGEGYVRKFDTDGVRQAGFAVNQGRLDAPWGLTIAPASFGAFGGALLVGNFSDNGIITAYDPSTGAPLVPSGLTDNVLRDESGNQIVIDELWALQFGNGGNGGDPNTLYFTAGTAEETHGLFGKLNATTATATSLIQFATTNFAVDEAAGHVDFTVVRTGDTSGTATVNYTTFDEPGEGEASQKSDYEIALGTLTFNPGETSKTFRVLLVNDNFVEGNETISLALSNPTGAGVGLGSPNMAEITILDNDAAPSASNPIDDPQFFVRQHYLDFLNREPDPSGFNFWVNQITSCGANTQCRDVRRINVSAAFFLSIEFRNTGLLAYLTNRAAFGPTAIDTPAPVRYGQFMHDVQLLQRNFVFGQEGSEAQLEANKQAYFAYTVSRPDFVTNNPTSLTPAQFVDRLFANAGITPSAQERNAAIAEFGTAADTSDQAARARALRRVAENPALAQADFNRAFVTMEYFGYLRRDPDPGGFNFWLNKLNSFGGNFIRAEMVKAFIASTEYRQRFGAS